MPTKEELEVELKKLREERDAAVAAVTALQADGEGWLVTTNNPLYEGRTLGVQFARGQAFVKQGRSFPEFEWKPMKDSNLVKYPETERKAIRAREQMSSAERMVEKLTADFGYEVVQINLNNQTDMQKLIGQRATEYAEAIRAREEIEKMAALQRPAYMPGR